MKVALVPAGSHAVLHALFRTWKLDIFLRAPVSGSLSGVCVA